MTKRFHGFFCRKILAVLRISKNNLVVLQVINTPYEPPLKGLIFKASVKGVPPILDGWCYPFMVERALGSNQKERYKEREAKFLENVFPR